MLLSVVIVADGRVGSLNSTSLLPVESLRAYRACDNAVCFPRGIVDGIFDCWRNAGSKAAVSYVVSRIA